MSIDMHKLRVIVDFLYERYLRTMKLRRIKLPVDYENFFESVFYYYHDKKLNKIKNICVLIFILDTFLYYYYCFIKSSLVVYYKNMKRINWTRTLDNINNLDHIEFLEKVRQLRDSSDVSAIISGEKDKRWYNSRMKHTKELFELCLTECRLEKELASES